MNQHYFDVPFAFSGDVTAIPDPLQVGGTVSFTEGWNFNYQRDLTTDPAALPIDRSTMNWLFLQITTALQALQQTAIPEWITAAQNGGVAFPYAKGAEVLYSTTGSAPFTKMVNLNASNTNTPNPSGDPTGATTGWQITADAISTAAQASAGTDNSTTMTPLRVAGQTALRALLAGSASQVFNVANATAATQAIPLQQAVGRLLSVTMFSTTGGATFTPKTANSQIYVRAMGGGGAGGSCPATGAGQYCVASGGSSGAYAEGFYQLASAAGIAITIGASGAPAAGAAGGNGGTTTVSIPSNTITCPGGNGGSTSGLQSTSLPWTTGTSMAAVATGGNMLNTQGWPAQFGMAIQAAAGNTGLVAGGGGISPLGSTVAASNVGQGVAGAGAIFGGGGRGTAAAPSVVAQLGGAGGAGWVQIFEYGTI